MTDWVQESFSEDAAAGVAPQDGDLLIEPMALTDLPEVLDIERASFPIPWSEQAFIGELTHNKTALYLVARRGDRVVAYGGMWIVTDEAHVTNIAVHPHFRRKGIGDRMLTALKEHAARHGCRSMTLEVRRFNTGAQNLYKKHGFVPRGIRRGYYTDTNEDAIIMWCDGLRGVGP